MIESKAGTHMSEYHNDSSAADRVEALRNDARQHQPMTTQGSTYLSRAIADAGSELGRYRSLSEVTIVGARGPQPTTYAQRQRDSADPSDGRSHAAEGLATGHDAMRLQRERMAQGLPHYPRQEHPFEADAGNIERPLGYSVQDLPDMTRVK
jgi:hypothetical protein